MIVIFELYPITYTIGIGVYVVLVGLGGWVNFSVLGLKGGRRA
jgi:hypothetical protein